MKVILQLMFLLAFVGAPFLATKGIFDYYGHYEALAKKYECYPVETCRADFNGDGKPDIFRVVDEPNDVYQHYYRLEIYIEENGAPKQILKIPFDNIDGTYRTHIAVAEFYGEKTLIIFDTINKEPYYIWDGERLSPLWDGKEMNPRAERAIYEQSIRQAMALDDDMGGFNEKIMLKTSINSLLALYYLLLSVAAGIYFYCKQKSKLKFF
jgi:hypothetical protein